MQLKKLHLLGFKTFADKTEILIDDGLTAIVGPNGSGKSNIVDALLWVLGEQNPRFLRGQNATDVIFAGTDKRKPLGMAEVRLTIDNTDQSLPIGFNEVTVTRRVYRSGESQYLLNGAPCRLKDIVELFLDTGVGKGAYAFVSQSEIDAVLSAKAEDRRELFEEAAGIKKYRVKKREALRKLDAAEANLVRVRDILRELEDQRLPMERQATEARRYLLLQERLHQIEVGLLVSELQKADYELFAGRQEREDDGTRLLKFDAELARLERQSEEVGERLAGAESELEAVQSARQTQMTTAERTASQLALITERGEAASRSQAQLKEELADIAERRTRLLRDIEMDTTDRDEAEREEVTRREEWGAQKAALVEMEAAYQTAVRETETRQSQRNQQVLVRAGQEAALSTAQVRLSETQARAERLVQESARLAETLQEVEERESEAKQRAESAIAEIARLARERTVTEEHIAEARTAQAAHRAALDTARRQQAEGASRLATLTELQESHEGFYQGVRAVLNAQKKGQLQGHYKPVVDLLTVPEPYRVAIEVALGGSLQDIVTLTEAEAKAGIGWLKQNRAGRATFLPLPLLRSGQPLVISGQKQANDARTGRTTDHRPLTTASGTPLEPTTDHRPLTTASAMDIVEYAPEYEKVAQMLLGRVVVVEDMDAAIALSRQLNGWSKIVTLEGELLTPGGALTGGSLGGRGAHLVGRKGEMDDLKARLPRLRAEVERLTGLVEESVREAVRLQEERDTLGRDEATAQTARASAESVATAAARDRERLVRERAERTTAQETLTGQISALTAEVARLTDLLAAGEAETETADDMLTTLTEEVRELAAKRDACRGRAVTLEVEVSRLRERREGLTRALATNRAALAALDQEQQQKSARVASTGVQGADAVAEQARLTAQLAEQKERLAVVEEEFVRWRDRRAALLAESFEINGKLKEMSAERAEVTTNLHKTELMLARLEVQVAQVTERLMQEYNISREEALARPEETSVDKNTAMEVGRLRREIRAMGTVNTGAVEEYERLTERFTFLDTQRNDLETGRASLLETIAEIDESTRGVFMETFDAVRIEFDRLFTRLFEGGSTKLILTHPEDLLETGIEVIAQPPGKKPSSLSLLSGGERALTATALLFAFLAVKPSPFVLLDEVDAPLDGANVEKFTRLVKEFSERSQFLIITHNPVTMESAPTWYGVTMREPGISSILSYRVPQEATVSESEAAVVLAV